jgi:hypothetical protein
MQSGREITMKRVVGIMLLLAGVAMAQRVEIEVLDSEAKTDSYNLPARGICLPGTNGPMCGVRGAEQVTVGTVRVKARVNDADVWLVCNTQKEKHCMQLKPGHFQAEPKGKDRIVIYAWTNPMYKGDFSKATKVTYFIGYRGE